MKKPDIYFYISALILIWAVLSAGTYSSFMQLQLWVCALIGAGATGLLVFLAAVARFWYYGRKVTEGGRD